jgi:hypothetical protein
MKWVKRTALEKRIMAAIDDYPVTLILGPRQCGKTSLARKIVEKRRGTYFDIEDPETPLQPDIARTVLKDLGGLVVIDEVQRQPSLFGLLRVLSDRRPLPARFLLLGSASPAIVKGISETLAGRVAYVDMRGFDVSEAGVKDWTRLWVRGGFPLAYLAAESKKSFAWRLNFIQSFLERDIPQLGIRVPATALRRFWTMLAHYHGQIWNASELARAMGVKQDTARHYLDILCGAFMVRQLPPWFENTGKRVVKASKIYLRDTGLLHALLGLDTKEQLLAHPRLGFSWEGFAMEEVIRAAQADRQAYFYRTHAGAEIDLLIMHRGKRYGFEFRFEDAPRPTRSMHQVTEDLGLERIWVVYPGDRRYSVSERIELLPLNEIDHAIGFMRR